MRSRCMVLIPVLMLVCHGTAQAQTSSSEVDIRAPLEVPEDAPGTPYAKGSTVRVETHVVRGGFVSVQVNVDEGGANFVGDAANEPSIAVDPTAPNRIVIGWRQFDTIVSNFRQAGWGYSNDGGRSWSFPGVINPGVFRSDPVLEVSPEGSFYYYSLRGDLYCQLFISEDSGQSWSSPIPAFGGDKAWVVVDRTGGIGHGNLYVSWSLAENPWGERVFTRSTDGGRSFMQPLILAPAPIWGTLAVGAEGELYIGGNASFATNLFVLWRSVDAADPLVVEPTFVLSTLDLGGDQVIGVGPNPVGLLGQVWVGVDTSDGPNRGNIYMMSSVRPPNGDPMDVHFVRSQDGGETWSEPIAVNVDDRGAWQWFATMSVAPNGRIDAVWVESLDGSQFNIGELYYTSSRDGGVTWADAVAITPSFDSWVGWPNQEKLGDYYHMISDDVGAHLAYAATFNDEQDVYYLRIGDYDCNGNGVGDRWDIARGTERDCDGNEVPDRCEIAAGVTTDSDGDGIPDHCRADPRRGGTRLP